MTGPLMTARFNKDKPWGSVGLWETSAMKLSHAAHDHGLDLVTNKQEMRRTNSPVKWHL